MQLLKFIEDKPRIIFLRGRNQVATQVLNFLNDNKEKVIAVFNENDEINLNAYEPDVIITCYWPFLLKPEIFKKAKYGCINFHPALLPKNRGWYPAVWEIMTSDKAGVTLHLVDENADTGPILAQKEFDIKETDTGGTVYGRSQLQMVLLFKQTWGKLFNGGVELIEQNHKEATYHTKKETNLLDEIDLNGFYKAEHLLRILRAKTFGETGYAYYMKNGKKYHVRVDVIESE